MTMKLSVYLTGGSGYELPAGPDPVAGFEAIVDLASAADVRLWSEVAQSSTGAWTKKMAQAAQSWSSYRQAR